MIQCVGMNGKQNTKEETKVEIESENAAKEENRVAKEEEKGGKENEAFVMDYSDMCGQLSLIIQIE